MAYAILKLAKEDSARSMLLGCHRTRYRMLGVKDYVKILWAEISTQYHRPLTTTATGRTFLLTTNYVVNWHLSPATRFHHHYMSHSASGKVVAEDINNLIKCYKLVQSNILVPRTTGIATKSSQLKLYSLYSCRHTTPSQWYWYDLHKSTLIVYDEKECLWYGSSKSKYVCIWDPVQRTA